MKMDEKKKKNSVKKKQIWLSSAPRKKSKRREKYKKKMFGKRKRREKFSCVCIYYGKNELLLCLDWNTFEGKLMEFILYSQIRGA